jgi:homoserine dehydrogenase
MVGDLIDVVTGRALLTSRVLNLWPDPGNVIARTSPHQIKSRYYLRFTIADSPGVLAALAGILGEHGISIASVIQHDSGDDAPDQKTVPLVIMTHQAVEAELDAALGGIDQLEVVTPPSVCLGVED